MINDMYFPAPDSTRHIEYQVHDDIEVTAKDTPLCVAKGTPIMLSNGVNKNVEDLTKNDKILAYDLFSGTYVERDILYIVHNFGIFTTHLIEFDNSKTLKIVGEEALFDVDERQFFTVDYKSASSVIGRRVLACDDNEIEYATIVNVTTTHEEIDAYTVYSYETLNYVANGIVAHYAFGAHLSNLIYSFTEDLKIDLNIYNQDVALYGFASYQKYSQYIEEKYFNGFKCYYANIMFGKGIMTEEEFINGLKELSLEASKHLPEFLAK